jgi:hypothetical protein
VVSINDHDEEYCKLHTSGEFISKGIEASMYGIADKWGNDGTTNIFGVYLIFNKTSKRDIRAIAYNKGNQDQENGRAMLHIETEADSSNYYEFTFNEKTQIEANSIKNLWSKLIPHNTGLQYLNPLNNN